MERARDDMSSRVPLSCLNCLNKPCTVVKLDIQLQNNIPPPLPLPALISCTGVAFLTRHFPSVPASLNTSPVCFLVLPPPPPARIPFFRPPLPDWQTLKLSWP